MPPSSLFFNGRLTYRPSAPTKIDATALASQGIGSTGIVAVLGSSVGGRPASTMTKPEEFVRLRRPGQEGSLYRSGNLREVMPFLFEPCRDPVVLGGAQQVIAMKVNPATQSSGALANSGGDAIDLTSRDYGAFTDQIWVTIASGTNKGKRISIGFEDIVESQDDLGGDNVFTLAYAGGYATMLAEITAAGKARATGSVSQAGLDSQITTQIAPGNVARVSSANAGDTTQSITIWGLDGSNNPAKEVLALNGTTAVDGAQVWNKVLGVELSAAAAGIVSVVDQGTPANVIFDIPAATLNEGLLVGVALFAHAASAPALVSDGASTKDVILVGRNAANQEVLQKVALTGTTPVNGTAGPVRWDRIIVGDVENAQTVTLTQVAVETDEAVQTTVTKVADYFNARKAGANGFTAVVVTGVVNYPVTKFDPVTTPVSILTATGFKADLYAIIDWINATSALISAAQSTGGAGAPDNTSQAVYLTGGSEGTTLFSHWTAALDQLKEVRVNTVVVMTHDPAVHAALAAHIAAMQGVDERDGVVGVQNAGLTGYATKAEIKQQIVDLNSAGVRVVAQGIERFDSSGTRRVFEPMFHAAQVAGAQAGSAVGTPLTYKYLNSLGFAQDTSWNPSRDAEEMLEAGLMFVENRDGVGRRWVRNITSYRVDSNLAYTEASVNHAVNIASFEYRQTMETGVGRRGFAGTVNALLGLGKGTASNLIREGTLTAAQNFNAELVLDVMEHSVELAPIIPINFIPTTIHLVNPAVRVAA